MLAVVERSQWNGRPTGVREWLAPGGLHEQQAVLVQAVHLVLGEIEALLAPDEPPTPTPKPTP